MKQGRHERQVELEKRLKELEREYHDTGEVVAQMNTRRKQVESEIRQLRNQISQLKPKELGVTDHALLRYMERHLGIDVEGIRKEILEKVAQLPDLGSMKIAGFVVKEKSVVTYVPEVQQT